MRMIWRIWTRRSPPTGKAVVGERLVRVIQVFLSPVQSGLREGRQRWVDYSTCSNRASLVSALLPFVYIDDSVYKS